MGIARTFQIVQAFKKLPVLENVPLAAFRDLHPARRLIRSAESASRPWARPEAVGRRLGPDVE